MSFNVGSILGLGGLLLCSAFFSASETAFSSVNRIKLKNLAAQGHKRAALALTLTEQYDKLLSTVLIGNNIVNIASSALATLLFVGFFGNMGVSIATVVMTVAVLIVGEISPKTLAKEAPERFAMFSAPLLSGLIFILSPVNRLTSAWKRMILKLFNIQGNRGVTEAELLTFVEEVRQEGGINAGEEDMIRQAIEFDDITAHDIFTPRVDVVAVSLSESVEGIDRKFCDTGYSRLPVYEDSIDNIIGVMLLKDFHHQVIGQKRPLESIIKPVVFITQSIKISKLLKTLQSKKSHMAVLVDEFGGTMGIITIEDIIEELVGEIWDEHDEVIKPISPVNSRTYTVLGNTSLEVLFDFFDLTGPALLQPEEGDEKPQASAGDDPHHRHTTVGNWVIEQLGGVPREGECCRVQDLLITISKVVHHRVLELTVTLPEPVQAEEESYGLDGASGTPGEKNKK
ncbi:MAG: hemolysin family protein [Treponema sp.]|jgi:CBS domain containing-hemolysin-like protein|nr:hemolysin family protein [Treponema sp.]